MNFGGVCDAVNGWMFVDSGRKYLFLVWFFTKPCFLQFFKEMQLIKFFLKLVQVHLCTKFIK